MAQFLPIENILINPELVEFVLLKASGLISFGFSDGTQRNIDSTAAFDPNDLAEIKVALENSGSTTFISISGMLINPARVAYVSPFNSGSEVTFSSGIRRVLSQDSNTIKNLIDERINGNVVKQVESFSLSLSIPAYNATTDVTAAFTASNLYSGVIPAGVTFTGGAISGFESGRWLIVPGLKYTSAQANSFPRFKTLVNDVDVVGLHRPYYPKANEDIYGSYSFVENLESTSTVKVLYGAENSTPASLVVRCSFVKLADKAATISNPNNALTIGGIVVTINGIPLVI